MEQQSRYSITQDQSNDPATNGKDAETRLLVGLPAYNEEVGIGSVVLNAQEFADEVVVVDDGSSDRTVDIAKAAGATVIEHGTNLGKGGAIKTLLEYADGIDPEVLVVLDADGQHDARDIPTVAEPVLDGSADLVIGSRYLEKGMGDETPLYRRFGQRVLDYLTLGSSGQNLTDTQSGFRAFSPEAIDRLELTTDGIAIESEMIDDASRKDLVMEERPISVRYEGIDGQTYNPLQHGLSVVDAVLGLIRDRRPLLFFAVPGLALVFIGTIYGLDGILIYRATGQFYPAKVFVAGFLTIIGTVSTFAGLMLNSINKKITDLKEFS